MQTIIHYLLNYGYLAVFMIILLEDFGMPIPGETALVAAGILAGTGQFHILPLLLLAFLGAVIGDNIGYLIGFYGGRQIVLKYGRYVFIREKNLAAVERFFAKYGNEVVMAARFVNGARQLNGIIAGTSRMPWWHFLLFNILGAALWVSLWGSLAFILGKRSHTILIAAKRMEAIVLWSIVAAVLGYGLYRYFRRRKTRGP